MGNICSRRDYLNFCEARQAHRNGLVNPSYVINNAPVYPYAFCNPSTYPRLHQPIHPRLNQLLGQKLSYHIRYQEIIQCHIMAEVAIQGATKSVTAEKGTLMLVVMSACP